jgi:hypothetical protein
MEDLVTLENGVALASFIYGALLYFLPPEKASKLNAIGNILTKIVNTPAGLKWKR